MQTMSQAMNRLRIPEHIEVTPPTLDDYLRDPGVQDFLTRYPELSTKQLQQSLSKLNEFVVVSKQARDKKIPYQPELYLGERGEIAIRYRPTAWHLEQKRLQQAHKVVDNGTLSKSVQQASFDDAKLTKERMPLIKAVKEFVTAYNASPEKEHKAVFVTGGYGVGKTYLLSAMANQLAKLGHDVRMEHFQTFVTNLFKIPMSEYHVRLEEIDRLKKVPVLILDDFGAEKLTEWVRDEVILVILEYRMNNWLPTFFTSNLSLSQVREHLSETKDSRRDEMKAGRIMERVNRLASELVLTGTNKRNPKGVEV